MAVGRNVVVDVRADDRIRAASAPFAMGKFALRGLELMQALCNWGKRNLDLAMFLLTSESD
jgi:hypothetical protein